MRSRKYILTRNILIAVNIIFIVPAILTTLLNLLGHPIRISLLDSTSYVTIIAIVLGFYQGANIFQKHILNKNLQNSNIQSNPPDTNTNDINNIH